MNWLPRSVAALSAVLIASYSPDAHAWGCEGHQLVAVIAEKQLNPRALEMAQQILRDGPIDPALHRFCKSQGLDAFVDSATWADDYREVDPHTAGWHFLDIPRGAATGDLTQYCSPTGCITSAIAEQLDVLRTPGADAKTRANALRFVIHFVGDLHQPLHATTNNDRGGNCVPVTYFKQHPKSKTPASHSYEPNLHGIWDTQIVHAVAAGRSLADVASRLSQDFQSQEAAWRQAGIDPASWAWDSHQKAEAAGYGALSRKIQIEPARSVTTCRDDGDVGGRMLKLNEVIGQAYEAQAEAVVREQVAKAGVRLAMILNELWPAEPSAAK
jgi:hypothetical protein